MSLHNLDWDSKNSLSVKLNSILILGLNLPSVGKAAGGSAEQYTSLWKSLAVSHKCTLTIWSSNPTNKNTFPHKDLDTNALGSFTHNSQKLGNNPNTHYKWTNNDVSTQWKAIQQLQECLLTHWIGTNLKRVMPSERHQTQKVWSHLHEILEQTKP